MGAELGAVVGIKGSLEQRTHDLGLDGLPATFGGLGELADFIGCQFKDRGILKEVAIEVPDLLCPEVASLGHHTKQGFEPFGEKRGVVHALLGEIAEDAVGQKSNVFREQAEDNPVEEAGDAKFLLLRDLDLRPRASIGKLDGFTVLERTRYRSDLLGEVFGDLACGVDGAQRLRGR